MIVFNLAARLLLAAVFVVAAMTKLADRAGTRAAVVEFGAPRRMAGALAVGLPLAELATAALLLPASTAVAGSVAALGLLVLFTAAVAISLARGRAPECHCFGQLHSAPASWQTLARNAALIAAAIVALVTSLTGSVSAVDWIGDLEGAELVALAGGGGTLLIVMAAGGVLVTLLRSYGRVLERLDRVEAALADAGVRLFGEHEMPQLGLEPGTAVPAFWATSLAGEAISAEELAESGRPSLLLFTSTECGPCKILLPQAAVWQREHAGALSIVFVSYGSRGEIEGEAEEHGLERVLLDEDRRLYDAFQANGTPSAVLVAPDGTIASWVASGSEWIEQLVAHAVGGGDEGGLPVGTEAPALELPSLSGDEVTLASLRGRASVLLFWNPDCGYCRSMHDDVLAWEASANGVAPRLVVISSGDAESSRAEGFRSLVLLDEDFAAGAAFSANGTPMAVLVDAEGRIGSPVVAGAENVLALAGRRE